MSLYRATKRRVWLRFVLPIFLGGGFLLPHAASPLAGTAASPNQSSNTKPAAQKRVGASADEESAAGTPGEQRDRALSALGVLGWHKAGIRGQGVKIAVLDSGFRGYQSFLGTALPAKVLAKSFRLDGNLESRDSQHGILCGEVIHALAPDAELILANWEPDQPKAFLQAVAWARQEGATIVSCSLIMPSWSDGEGGGTINHALTKVVGSDMLCFASAGNLAQRHWCGKLQPDKEGYHQWTTGERNNVLVPWGNDRVSAEVYGPACEGLELQVFEAQTGKLMGRCAASIDGSPSGCPCAVVRFEPKSGANYFVRIRGDQAATGGKNAAFHLVILAGGLECNTACSSIPFPADAPAMHAVGAVDTSGQRHYYSSCGPNSPLLKPDFVAQVPFPSLWRDRPFSGTSAAAPQAAGLAALLRSRFPTWTAEQVSNALRQASCDLGPAGHDWETGHGLLKMPNVGLTSSRPGT